MRRTLFIATMTAVFVGLMTGTAFAHICYVAEKPQGSGSAGTATVLLDIAVDEEGNEVDFAEVFIPGADLQFNEKTGRFVGGFVTLTVDVNVWLDTIGSGTPIFSFSETVDVLIQNTVGGGAHFAGPGESGCDGVGMDSLEACLLEAFGA